MLNLLLLTECQYIHRKTKQDKKKTSGPVEYIKTVEKFGTCKVLYHAYV